MATIQEFFNLFKLASNRLKSENNYIKFQNYQAKLILKELKKRGIFLNNLKVLELGSGKGGYSLQLYKETKNLTLADINKPRLLLKKYPNLRFFKFNFSKKFPLRNNQFDFIFCLSTIEHIKNPLFFLKECERILKSKGFMFLTFPPFYGPIGGHSVKPFHYLGENTAIKITNILRRKNIKNYEKMFGNWGLYRLKIKDVKALVNKTNFEIKGIWTRYSKINFAKIPLLNEILTWHVHFLLQKK